MVFFFQAEDGIRDYKVTGVQTCALPISFSKLDREYGSRPNSRTLASASRDVPCCISCAITRAVCGSQPSPTTPARRLTASTTLPPGCPPRSPDLRYNDRSTDTEPAIV